jgi:monofunctional biosynthetic peptidoglycan transglycosylase
MERLFILLLAGAVMISEIEIKDFNSIETSAEWEIINDGVMGGLSQSTFEINSDGTATFKGNVSPENNGGFASVRTVIDDMDLQNYEGAVIRIKGDGKIYSLRFRTDQTYDGISYQAKFETEPGTWKEHKIPFENFTPVWRGRFVPNQPQLISGEIKQVGILISDKQYGDFELNIDWIKFY